MIGLLVGSFDERRTKPLDCAPQRRVINVKAPSPFTGLYGCPSKMSKYFYRKKN